VLSRSGDQLVVRGATLVHSNDGDTRFVRNEISVVVGPQTKVIKNGVRPLETLDAGAISVGQRIQAFGNLRQENERWILDASQSRVRMHVTHLYGQIKQTLPGTVTLDVDAIDGRRPGAFDFAGTGVTASFDADPENYEVATGLLNVNDLVVGESVRVFGFVTAFGTAPPDFSARTLVEHRQMRASLSVGFLPQGSMAPFLNASSEGLLLNLSDPALGGRHHLRIGERQIDLLDLAAAPNIAPPSGARTAYVISKQGVVTVFIQFSEFVAALNQHLNGTTTLLGLTAHGAYESSSNVLTAHSIIATIK
jgi:hypothetical protein